MASGKETAMEMREYAKATVDAIAEKYLKPGMEEMLSRASEEYLKQLREEQSTFAVALDYIVGALQNGEAARRDAGASYAAAEMIRHRLRKIYER